MTPFSLAFFFGVLMLQFFQVQPSAAWILVSLAGCLVLFWSKLRAYPYLIALLLGFSWCLWNAHQVASFSLSPILEGKPLWIRGEIISLPRISPQQTSFQCHLKGIQTENLLQSVSTKINLSWPHAPALRMNQEWLLPVRLKKIHSTMNPGGFDFEAWAFENGIRAKGYVLEQGKPLLIAENFWSHPLASLRQYIQREAQRRLPSSRSAPWLLALMTGERAGISQSQWEVLRNTGTNHLMAIAGLHIGFLSLLSHWLTLTLWRHPVLLTWLPAPQAGACAALCMAVFYSALAGFSIPTQRAIVMIAVYLFATLSRRLVLPWQAWSLALLLVLIMNPLSLLSSSFWLSFATLALIIYSLSGRLSPQGPWWKWGRPQAVLAVGLLPLTIWFFMQYSLVSFLANLIAIPWVGFLILPFCFLSIIFLLLCPSMACWSLWLADKSLSLLWSMLSCLAHWPWSMGYHIFPHEAYVIAACAGVLILLLPRGFPGRFLGLCWLLPALCYKPVPPSWGELRFTLLDVGQGLSVVLQTQKHVLVFDAGPRYGPESDLGESVVLPYLHSQGLKQIDKLVISHPDNDHSGGAAVILKSMPVYSLLSSEPSHFSVWPAAYCLAGQAWDWDGVHFAFLHPSAADLSLDNDSSCVLRVSTRSKSLLLPGDIEKTAERILLERSAADLPATLLVAPHHGSKTSGWRDFVGRIHPDYVLYAIGYRNRYHFPYPDVVATYREFGALQLDTATAGAIQFEMGPDFISTPHAYRLMHKKYWNQL